MENGESLQIPNFSLTNESLCSVSALKNCANISGISPIKIEFTDYVTTNDLYKLNGDLDAIYSIKLSEKIPTMKRTKVVIINELEVLDRIWTKMCAVEHPFLKDDYRIKVIENKLSW